LRILGRPTGAVLFSRYFGRRLRNGAAVIVFGTGAN